MKITIKGDKALYAKLNKAKNLDALKEVVQKNGDELNQQMKRETKSAFRGGYTTGQTASSINTEISDNGLTASVAPTTEYAQYVEYGTRFMQPEPFVSPAFEKQKPKFEADLKKLTR